MRKAKKKAERDGQSYELFDCWGYHWAEESRLQGALDAALSKSDYLEKIVGELTAEVDRLLLLVNQHEEKENEIMFSLTRIVECCKECYQWEDVRGVVSVLGKLTRFIITQTSAELIDSIEEHFKAMEKAKYGDHIEANNYNAVVKEQNNQFTLKPDENKGEAQKLIG